MRMLAFTAAPAGQLLVSVDVHTPDSVQQPASYSKSTAIGGRLRYKHKPENTLRSTLTRSAFDG